MFYEHIVRPLLFGLSANDPEKAHNLVLALLNFLGKQERLTGLAEKFTVLRDQKLEQEVFGLKFPNPVGLAAGFDKNAFALPGLQVLGFGFIEAGTVTQYEQEGNPRPRITRLPRDEAIINWMGFNNDGADKVAARLAKSRKLEIPLGISLGKSKVTPLEKAIDDYLYSFRVLYPYAGYYAVNVSSPNTPGLRQLQDKEYLDILLLVLEEENRALARQADIEPKSILVKIAPDLSWEAIDQLLQVCFDRQAAGLIIGNTTISRKGLSALFFGEGGMSGRPLWPQTINIIRYVAQQTGGQIPLIGVGGIFGLREALEALKYVSLIQVFTGLIYQGPLIARQINKDLILLMEKEGIKHISELRR